MRDIIFRGKTKDGKWVYGSLVITTHGLENKPNTHTKTWIVWNSFGNGGWFNVKGRSYALPETVGQWTGLLDCEGNKIYEGDIVNLKTFINGNFVDYKNEKFRVCWNIREWVMQPLNQNISSPKTFYIYDNEKLTVVGNIIDNPELLEV